MHEKKNIIPRHFYRIAGELLTDTTEARKGDTLHIYRNDFGLVAYCPQLNDYVYVTASLLRDAAAFRVCEILQ